MWGGLGQLINEVGEALVAEPVGDGLFVMHVPAYAFSLHSLQPAFVLLVTNGSRRVPGELCELGTGDVSHGREWLCRDARSRFSGHLCKALLSRSDGREDFVTLIAGSAGQ